MEILRLSGYSEEEKQQIARRYLIPKQLKATGLSEDEIVFTDDGLSGIIRGYTALVDREQVGLALCVLAEVNLTRHNEDDVRRFEKEVAACPPIVSCYSTTGQADYVLKVLVPDIKAYETFLHETMFKLPGVTHVRSSVVLKEVKAETRLPLDPPAPQPRKRPKRL